MHFGSVTQKPALPKAWGGAGACLGGLGGRQAARFSSNDRRAALCLRLFVFPARGVPSLGAAGFDSLPGRLMAGGPNDNPLRTLPPSLAPTAPCPLCPEGQRRLCAGLGRAVSGFVCASRLHAGASLAADPFGKEPSGPKARRFPSYITCSNPSLSRTPGRRGRFAFNRPDFQAPSGASKAGRRLALRWASQFTHFTVCHNHTHEKTWLFH